MRRLLHRAAEIDPSAGKGHLLAVSALSPASAGEAAARTHFVLRSTASGRVADTVRHVPGGDVPTRRFDVVVRIIEENVGAERLQKRPLVATAQE